MRKKILESRVSYRKILGVSLIAIAFCLAAFALMATSAEAYEEKGVPEFDPACPECLVSLWRLDEDSGITAADDYNDNDGTLYNDPTWTTGQINGAIEFDGVDDYVGIPDDSSLDIEDTLTIECWFNVSEIPGDNGYNMQTIVSKDTNYEFHVHDNGKLYWWWEDSSNNPHQLYSNATIDEETWYHATVVYDQPSGTAKMYLNGVLENKTKVSSTLATNDLDVHFGKNHFNMPRYFDGKIDEVAIYDCALSESEILQRYHNGLAGIGIDTTPPEVEITVGTPKTTISGDYGELPMIGAGTPVTLTATDPGYPETGSGVCTLWVSTGGPSNLEPVYDGDPEDQSAEEGVIEVSFEFYEDCWHQIDYRAVDCCGNYYPSENGFMGFDFYVDATPPTTNTEIVGPNDPIEGTPYSWLGKCTTKWLNVTDSGCQGGAGVEKLSINVYKSSSSQGPWEFVDSYVIPDNGADGALADLDSADYSMAIPFHFNEDCWHMVEHWGVDRVGNEEEVSPTTGTKQIHKIDATPPDVYLDYDGCEKEDDVYCIKTNEPISLTVINNGTAPCKYPDYWGAFRIGVDEGEGEITMHPASPTDAYANYGPSDIWAYDYDDDGTVEYYYKYDGCRPFYFTEECHHIVEYFGKDPMCNTGGKNITEFYVDDTAPIIDKTVNTENCYQGLVYESVFDEEVETYCVTTDTEITIDAEDLGCCGILEEVSYRVYADGWGDWYEITEDLPYVHSFESECHHLLQIRAVDCLGNYVYDNESFYVDDQAPTIIKTVGDPNCSHNDPGCGCPLGEGDYCVTTDTVISLEAYNNGCCLDTEITLEYNISYYNEDDELVWTGWTSYECTGPFTFTEECKHTLFVRAYDCLGNGLDQEDWDIETFYVDNQTPKIDKIVESPNCPEPEGADFCVRMNTPIYFKAWDEGCCPCDIDFEYRVWNDDMDTDWLNVEDELGPAISTGTYSGYYYLFNFEEECFHHLDLRAIDCFGRTVYHNETFFVDSTVPYIEKTVGDPNCTEDGETFCVTTDTPITIDAWDEGCCGILENVSYRIYYDGNWGPWIDILTEVQNGEYTFTFDEECKHALEIQAVDCLGNHWEDEETFYVDDTSPIIDKTVNEENCYKGLVYESVFDENVETYCVTTDTIIEINAWDDGCCDMLTGVEYNIWYDGEWQGWTDIIDDLTFSFSFNEECKHLLSIRAYDCLGNIVYDNETFYVDDQAPHIEKTVGDPNCRTDVLILYADNVSKTMDVYNKLSAYQDINIDLYDVNQNTPTLAELQDYDAVLVYSNRIYDDPELLGDVLADYADNGGGVVVAVFSWNTHSGSDLRLKGRYMDENYGAIQFGDYDPYSSGSLGTIHEPAHPIMQGVTSFSTPNFRSGTSALTQGATLIAEYDDGQVLVAVNDTSGIYRTCALGFLPPSDDILSTGAWDSSTDGDLLMHNALLWAAGQNVNPAPETLCVTTDTEITIDAWDLGCCGILENVSYRINGGAWIDILNDVITGEYTFTFTEECMHELEIQAIDCLGNKATDIEIFYVDDTYPHILKEVGEPNCDGGGSNGLKNPGFESGDFTNWQIESEADSVSVITDDSNCLYPIYGRYMARLGDDNGGYEGTQPEGANRISQIFTAQGDTFNFAYNIYTYDYEGYNHFSYTLETADGNTEIEHYEQDAWGSGNELKMTGWQMIEIDISAYEGQELKFTVNCSGTEDTSYSTWAYVDAHVDRWCVTTDSEITINAWDEGCCDILENVSYRIWYDDNWGPWIDILSYVGFEGNGYILTFEEECHHKLEIQAKDCLGHTTTDVETFYVDDQAPYIEKIVGDPNCPVGLTYEKMFGEEVETYCVKTTTEITIDAWDQGCCNQLEHVWVREYYEGKWTKGMDITDSLPYVYTFDEECHHLLQIVAEDCLGNMIYDNESFFVDDTPPAKPIKTVGKPHRYLGLDDYGHDVWLVSTETEISFDSDGDLGCGPCTDVTIYWRYWNLGEWTDWMEYEENITLPEGCAHYLEAYAVDCLGNVGPVDNETFWVCSQGGSQSPELQITVENPKWSLPGEEEVHCEKTMDVTVNVYDSEAEPEEMIVLVKIREKDGGSELSYLAEYNETDGKFHAFVDIYKYHDGTKLIVEATGIVLDENGNPIRYNDALDVEFEVCSTTVFDQWMEEGWNSLTLPPASIGCNNTIEHVLTSINDGNFDKVYWYNKDTKVWISREHTEEYGWIGSLTTMKTGEEYWVHIKEDARFFTDTNGPTINIDYPTEGAEFTNTCLSENISGTASDFETGIKEVKITIQDDDTGYYWDGTSWTADYTELDVTGKENWLYEQTMDIDFESVSGHKIVVTAMATDIGSGCTSTDTTYFYCNYTAEETTLTIDPSSLIGDVEVKYYFTLTATDIPAGISTVEFDWNFQDGTTGTKQAPVTAGQAIIEINHTYMYPGSFGLLAGVKDLSDNLLDEDYAQITIGEPIPDNNYTLDDCGV